MSHTPGPWRTIKHNWSTTGIYVDDSRVAKNWRIGELTIEQEATEDNQHILEAIAEANARLISSAPELLEELRAYHDREWRSPHEGLPRHMASDNCEGCAGCAAIAKAEGRTSGK